jgi:hypothetical protein
MSGRRQRVLMLIDRYWPHVGGGEGMVKTICDLLAGRAAELTVVTRNYTGDLPATELVDGAPVVRLGGAATGGSPSCSLWPERGGTWSGGAGPTI